MTRVPRVVVAEPLAAAELGELVTFARVVHVDGLRQPERLAAELADADALIVRSGVRVTAQLLSCAPRLRVVGRAGVGVDNVDLDAATERGVLVVNVPDGNTVAVAEHTMALMLASLRHLMPAHAAVRSGRWERGRFVGTELRGKVLGLIGFGRIGQEVAVRAAAFGMRILACDPYVPEARMRASGVEPVTLERLLEAADVVSVHVPLTDATRNLLDARALARMKRGAFLVNTARGGIVDEEALAERLRDGHLAGAALDVFASEPPVDSPLLDLPHVVLTPHLGGSTREAQAYNARAVAEQVARALRGEAVRGAVNLPRLSDEDWNAVAPLAPVAELLGLIYREGLGGPLDGLELRLAARQLPSSRAFELLAGAALKGLLEGVVSGPVNVVNAPVLAARRGVELRWRGEHEPSASSPVVEIAGGRPRRSVAARLGVDGAVRLVNLDGLPLDMIPSPVLLLTRHSDRPGMIGRVGGVLGAHGINIAAMQVARRQVRGEAIMVLALDDPVGPEVLEAIRATAGIEQARALAIPAALLRPVPAVSPGAAAGAGEGSAGERQEGAIGRC